MNGERHQTANSAKSGFLRPESSPASPTAVYRSTIERVNAFEKRNDARGAFNTVSQTVIIFRRLDPCDVYLLTASFSF